MFALSIFVRFEKTVANESGKRERKAETRLTPSIFVRFEKKVATASGKRERKP